MNLQSLHYRVFGILAVGAIAIGLTYWWYSDSGNAADEKFNYVYCPNCKLEFPFDDKLLGKSCVKCLPKTYPMKGSTVSMRSRTTPPRTPEQKCTRMVYIELYIIAAALFYVLFQNYTSGPEVAYIYFRCPHCDTKLRFRESQAGSIGQCPRCKKPLTFPQVEVADD